MPFGSQTGPGRPAGLRRGRRPASFAAAIWLAAAPEAAAAVRFNTGVNLPDAGLRARIMTSARDAPFASPRVFAHPGEAAERFLALDLWRSRQSVARWRDGDGNTLVIAAVHHPFPHGLSRTVPVPPETFERAMPSAGERALTWTPDTLAHWAADFTGAPAAAARAFDRPPRRLQRVFEFRFAPPRSDWFAVTFQLDRGAPGQHRAPETRFFAWFASAGKAPLEDRETLVGHFLDGLSATGQRPDGREGFAPHFQNRRVAARIESTPELEAGRRLAIESIRNLRDWWYVEAPGFIILSNLDSRHRATVRELQARLETLRSVFETLIPLPAPLRSVGVVRIFADSAAYVDYVGPRHAATLGVWIPDRREFVIRHPDFGRDGTAQESLLRTVAHESFHQYLFHALDRRTADAWFNEGHAVFFENAEIRGRRVRFQEDPQRVEWLERLMAAGPVDLRRLVTLSYPDFYASHTGDAAARQTHYTLAWALVYYLHKGCRVDGNSSYNAVISRYLEAFESGTAPGEATRAALENVDLDELRDRMTAFWTSRARRRQALSLRLLPP